MRLRVTQNQKKYDLSFMPVTQLAGTNVAVKSFIIDSLCKHFSSDKYKEYEECYIDNITLDGEVPGRKQWESTRITNKEDLVNALLLGKTSIVTKCIKQYVTGFDCQNELLKIDEILLHVFDEINKAIFRDKKIELQYSQEDLFSMIQKTDIKTTEGYDLHTLDTGKLLDLFFDIIEKQQLLIPEKRLYVFENIDHIITSTKYHKVIERCLNLSEKFNVWFVFTVSLRNYIYFNSSVITGINVINENIFTFPEYERILSFVMDNYPSEKEWKEEELNDAIRSTVHSIGVNNSVVQPQYDVILKLINESLGIKNMWDKMPTMPEIQYLIGKNLV